MGGSSFVNGALIAAGRWFITLGSISWRIPRLRSGLGLRAFHGREKRQRSRGRCVASRLLPCARASRAAAKMCDPSAYSLRLASLRTLVRTEQAEATLTAIDASMSCQVISCRPHARSDGQTRRANRVASGFRKLETLQQHPLAPTALTIDRCGGEKTQAHSDGERAAREISAAGEPVERAANHARPGGGARCARAARLQWQQPLGHKKAGAAECLSKYREGRRARRAEI